MQRAEDAGVDQPLRLAVPRLPAEVLVHDELAASAISTSATASA